MIPSIRKAASLFIVFSLLANPGVSADFSSVSLAPFSEKPLPFSLELPFDLGKVEETLIPEDGAAAPRVILIQTLHGHYETALKIKNLVEYLRSRYGADLLFAEGASGRLHPEYLRFTRDQEKNRALLDALVRKGEMTGADLAVSEGLVGGLGIENPRSYKKSYDAFKIVLGALEDSEKKLEASRMDLDRRASRVIQPALREALSRWLKFGSGRLELLATVDFLRAQAPLILGVDFETAFAQFDWPQVTRLVLLTELGKRERAELWAAEKPRLIEKIQTLGLDPSFPDFLETRGSRVLPRRRVEDFLAKAAPAGFQFKEFPQAVYKAASQVLESEIDSRLLHDEISRLFEKILESSARSPEERALIQEYKRFVLADKLLRLELSPEEWRDWQVKGLKSAGDYGEALAETVKQAETFYLSMEEREEAFLESMDEALRSGKNKTAVLVAGGFHGREMMRRLESRGIASVLVSPHVSGSLEQTLYQKTMLRGATLEQTLLSNEAGVSKTQGWNIEAQAWAVRQILKDEGLEAVEGLPYFSAVEEALGARSELRVDEQEFIELIHRARGPQLDLPLRPNDPDWVVQLNPEFIAAHRQEFIEGINALADALENDGRVLMNGISYIDLSAAFGFHLEQVDSLILMGIGSVLNLWTLVADIRREGDTSPVKDHFPVLNRIDFEALGRSELRVLKSPFAAEDQSWDGIVRKYSVDGKIADTRDAEGNPIGKFATTPSPYVDSVFAAMELPSEGPALVIDAGHGTGVLLGRLASRARRLNPSIRLTGIEGSRAHFKASQGIHAQALKKNLTLPGQVELLPGNFNSRKDLFRQAAVVVYAEAGSSDLDAFAETLLELQPGARLVTIGTDGRAPGKLRDLLTLNGSFEVQENDTFPRITVYTRRSELRTVAASYELLEKEFDVRTLFAEDQQDKPLKQIVFVSDNTGTMVQGYGDPLTDPILSDSVKLLEQEGFFLLVNSGDPLKDLADKTYGPLLNALSAEGRERFHLVADGGSRRVGFDAEGGIRYREELESWPKTRRYEYAKALAEAFYKQLKKRQGALSEIMKEIPDSEIDAFRDHYLQALEALGSEAWGEKKAGEAKYVFDIFPNEFKPGWGQVFIYDVGTKVTFDVPAMRDFLPPEFTPEIMAEVQKKYPPGTEDLYVVSVPGAVDMARVSKIEGVEKTLKEHIYQRLDPKQPLLMVVIGDGDNDIPTFSLKGPAAFAHAVVPVFIRSLPSYAGRLPDGAFIAKDKMAGTAQVLNHLALHAGKKIAEIPPLKLRQWIRSELRVDTLTFEEASPTKEDLLGLKFMQVSDRAMAGRDEIFVQVEGIPEGIYVHRNVFNPAIKNVSSPLLGQVLEINPGDSVLDIGSGTGYQAIVAVKKGAGRVVATDVSEEAVSNIQHNIRHLGIEKKLEARRSDLFEAFSPDEKFDLIIFSPPLLSGRPSSVLERSIYDDQRGVLKRFLEQAPRHLAPGGRVQMIFSEDAADVLRELVQDQWNVEILETRTYEQRRQGYQLLKLEMLPVQEPARSELRAESAALIGLDGRLKGLDLYEKVFSKAPDTTLRVGRDIAHTGALQAASILRAIQAKRKAYDAEGQKDRDVFIIFATGNTQWLGLTTLASILDSWGSWDEETRQLLAGIGVDLSDKPDMSRIFATHLDTIFPQSRDDYYSYANELHSMFDKLGIPREKRRMFYGDVKNDLIEPGADNQMDKASLEKVQASIDEEGLKLDEFLEGQLALDHPQYAYLDAVNRYTKKMSEFVQAQGPDIALFSAGPSYEGKGHFAFNEAGTPFDQGLVMALLSYHAAAGNIKDRGGMQHFRTREGAVKIGGATLGPKEIRGNKPVFITIINGKEKRESVRSLVERTADIQYPMTALQTGAPGSTLIMESSSGSTLRFFSNPWDFSEIAAPAWTRELRARLFVRLSKETGKPVSALTVDDWLQGEGKDQSEIAALRTKNLISLTSLQRWEVLRDEVVKTLAKEPLKPEQVPARLGLRAGDEIVHIGPHLDDLSLAAQFLVSEFSKQGQRLYSYYTAPGYTAVSDEYVLSALASLKTFTAEELAALDKETLSVSAFKQSEEKYLRELIEVLAGRELAYDPMNYDTWSLMPPEEQKLRAKLLFLRLNFESSLTGQLSSPERVGALRDTLEIYIKAKPHWGSSEIVVMQKLKVALRFVEEQTELMSRGVKYDDIFFPFQSSWYALERKGTARQSDIDVIKDVIRSKQPKMVIVNGEGFMDHGAHSITEMTVKVAVKELYEEAALPEGFRMFFYRGVWDRAEITGRPDQILVALGEEELNENKSSFVRNYPSQAPALVPDASVQEPMFFSDQVVINARETLAEWAALNGRATDDPVLQGILAFDMTDFNSQAAVRAFFEEVVAKKTELDRVQIPINRASLSKIIGSAPPYADLSGGPGERFLSALAAADFPFETVLTKEEAEKTKVHVRSELRTLEQPEPAADAAKLLFKHLAVQSKDIPADHALVVLGNPYEGYAQTVVNKARELDSPEIVILGKGNGAEPERMRLRREILAIDPDLAPRIKGFDSVDESMHTGMNVTSLAQAVKDGAVQSGNFVLTQIPTGALLSLRIFEHQWKQNAEALGLSLKTPGFYFAPVDYPFDIEAPLTSSKEERFYLDHAVGQIDRLKAWPLNPNPPLVLKAGDLTDEILKAADTVRDFLARSELRDSTPGTSRLKFLEVPALRLPFVAAPAERTEHDAALRLAGMADPSWTDAELSDYRLAMRRALEAFYGAEVGERFEEQTSKVQSVLRENKQVIALFAHIEDVAADLAIRQIMETAVFIAGENQAKAHYIVLTADRAEDAELLRDKLLAFLREKYPQDAGLRNQLYSRIPVISAEDPGVKNMLPKGALSAWVDWSSNVQTSAVIPEPARNKQIHADQLPGGEILKFDETNRGYGVSLLQAALLLLQGEEDSRLQQIRQGLYVQSSRSALAGLTQMLKTLQLISKSA